MKREAEIDVKQAILGTDMKVKSMHLQLIKAIKNLIIKQMNKKTINSLENKEEEIKALESKL